MKNRTKKRRRSQSPAPSAAPRKRPSVSLAFERLEDRLAPASLLDFGDAPNSYGTLLANNGASHAPAGPTLGTLRDSEIDGQPHSFAQGDDAAASDDEDGVFAANLVLGQTTTFTINVTGGPAKLDAWVDFNRNGVFDDPSERITGAGGSTVVPGNNSLPVTPPANAGGGLTFARFRLSTTGGLAPSGPASDGEVEDCPIHIYSGTRLIVTSGSFPRYELYSMNPDGSGEVQLTNNQVDDTNGVFSPDGSKIAFTTSRDGNDNIYVMNADGSGVVQLTSHPASDAVPAWSPDGTRIAFQSSRTGLGIYEIYVMKADGSDQTQLTFGNSFSQTPFWSPDGRKIVFQSSRSGRNAIWIMNADGSEQHQISPAFVSDQDPAWSPDGSRIAFLNRGDGGDEIYVMNIDGSGRTRLTNNTDGDYYPLWSPDGSKIAFAKNPQMGSVYDVYVMNADGSNPVRVTNKGTVTSPEAWGGVIDRPFDFGDAPENYGTTATMNGPRHLLGGPPAPGLGELIDEDTNGAPHSFAQGDDVTGVDDEDGVSVPNLVPGQTASFSITVTRAAGKLDAWVDFNRNGEFDDSTERITAAGGAPVAIGVNILTVAVPADSSPGRTFARFRISAAGGLFPTGFAADGEVEDYSVNVHQPGGAFEPTYDFGDAPDSYGTTHANNGARHLVGGLRFGEVADDDGNGEPGSFAQGDDSKGADDEDGVFAAHLVLGQTTVFRFNVGGAAGKLDAWVDFNRNGIFDDTSERITAPSGTDLVLGANGLSVTPPTSSSLGLTYARFRLSSVGGLAPVGSATDGEVEDYPLYIYSGTKIAYARGSGYDITVIDPDGTGQTRLTDDFRDDRDPDWSPDGGKIVFITTRDGDRSEEIYVMAHDGRGLTRLTDNAFIDASPSWSPDGSQIAFISTRDGSYAVYVMNADGSGQTRLTSISTNDFNLDWSADGRRILFGSNQQLHAINADGSGLAQLTSGFQDARQGSWSPDGGRIAFLGFRDGNSNIYVMNVDGSNVIRLTSADGPIRDPAWSPDGNQLVFAVDSELHIMNADGSGVRRLTNDPALERTPSWGGQANLNSSPLARPGGPYAVPEGASVTVSGAGSSDPDGAIISYEWDLDDDGVFEVGPSSLPSATFSAAGLDGESSRTVRLRVTDNRSAHDTGTATVRIINVPPTVTLTGNSAVTEGEVYSLTLGAVSDPGVDTVSGYRIDWGDGTSTSGVGSPTGKSANHVYADGPSYRITVDLTDEDGVHAACATKDIIVSPALPFDFGDAPVSYGTTLAGNGARHSAVGPILGVRRGTESDGQPHSFAQGDDAGNSDDEDGVFAANLVLGQTTTFAIKVAGNAAKLDAWVDFNRNGVFDDPSERITATGGTSVAVGTNAISVTPPADTSFGLTYARFRLSTSGGLAPQGPANDGEIEDYPIYVYGDSRIAFAGATPQGGSEIFVMNPDGSGQINLTNFAGADFEPTWSPDGRQIGFEREGIYAMNADGTGQRRLEISGAYAPAWSPDGSRFAFNEPRTGTIGIAIRNIDGTGYQSFGSSSYSNSDPSWSPDGRSLAFSSSRDGNLEIYVMNIDGTGLKRLTNASASDSHPAWSSDGGRIAFIRDGRLWVMNIDSTSLVQLTNTGLPLTSLAWSPDGKKLVFSQMVNPGSSTRLYTINADGTELRQLTETSFVGDAAPAWGGIPGHFLPVPEAGGPYSVSEEGQTTLSGVGSSDPDGTIVSYEWDLDNNGTFEVGPSSSPTTTFSAAGLEGGVRTVRLRVTDNQGANSVDTATVNVVNTVPTIALSSGDWLPEGAVYVVRLGEVVDPDPDTITSYRINWGDGKSTEGSGSPAGKTLTHGYTDDGNYTVTVDLTDEDGTHLAAGSKSIVVDNVATFLSGSLTDTLVVDRNGNGLADAGDVIEYTATITNDGPDNALGVTYAAQFDSNTALKMPPPATGSNAVVFADDFERAGGDFIGQNWTENLGNLGIAAGRLTGTSGNLTNIATATGVVLADVHVAANYDLGSGEDFNHVGLIARSQSPGNDRNMYAGIIYRSGSSFNAGIWRNVEGGWTRLTGRDIGAGVGNARFEAVGAALRLFIDDLLVASTFDVTFREGAVGVRMGTGTFIGSFNVMQIARTVFQDDFNRASSSDPGPSYAETPLHGAAGDYAIQNNQLVGVGGFINVAAVTSTALADVSVQADVNLVGTDLEHAGLIARYQGPGNNNMYAGLIYGVNGEYYSMLWKSFNGSTSVLDTRPVKGPGGTLRLDVIGTALMLYLNESLVATSSDTSITGPGLAGVRSSNQAFDNLSIAPLVENLGFRDGFDRGNSSSLGDRWRASVGDFSIQNNRAVTGTSFVNLASPRDLFFADVSAQADVNLTGAGFIHQGVVARYQGVGDRDMYAGVVWGTPGDYAVSIFKNVGGVWSILSSRAAPATSGTLRLEVIGNSLRLFFNEILVGDVIDSSLSRAGLAGLRGGSAGQAFDNLRITPLSVPLPTAGGVSQNLGTLLPGQSGRAVYRAAVNNPLPANVTRVEHAGTIQGIDSGTGVNYAPVATNAISRSVFASPDMRVTITGPAEFRTTDSAVFWLTYSNLGTQDATGVRLQVSFPIDITLQSGSTFPDSGAPAAWTPNQGQSFELFLGDVAARSSRRVTLVVKTSNEFQATQNMTVTATVRDDGRQGNDLDPNNNQGQFTFLLRGPRHPFLDW